MTRPRKRSRRPESGRIPEFTSREEEAAFWDTHDIADYQDELKTVRARFVKHLSEEISVRLDPETLADLRSRAEEQGVSPTALVRTWILKHLREKEGQSSRA